MLLEQYQEWRKSSRGLSREVGVCLNKYIRIIPSYAYHFATISSYRSHFWFCLFRSFAGIKRVVEFVWTKYSGNDSRSSSERMSELGELLFVYTQYLLERAVGNVPEDFTGSVNDCRFVFLWVDRYCADEVSVDDGPTLWYLWYHGTMRSEKKKASFWHLVLEPRYIRKSDFL